MAASYNLIKKSMTIPDNLVIGPITKTGNWSDGHFGLKLKIIGPYHICSSGWKIREQKNSYFL